MLHKFSAVRGFHIHAIDGDIGHVDDLLLDEVTRSLFDHFGWHLSRRDFLNSGWLNGWGMPLRQTYLRGRAATTLLPLLAATALARVIAPNFEVLLRF